MVTNVVLVSGKLCRTLLSDLVDSHLPPSNINLGLNLPEKFSTKGCLGTRTLCDAHHKEHASH